MKVMQFSEDDTIRIFNIIQEHFLYDETSVIPFEALELRSHGEEGNECDVLLYGVKLGVAVNSEDRIRLSMEQEDVHNVRAVLHDKFLEALRNG